MSMHLPPMQALRAFDAAATTRSLTRAAAALHLTHGAISHQIKSLESLLGVRLVERDGRGIRLTDAGLHFAQRIQPVLADLAAAVREIAGHTNPRRLRVSVMPSFAACWLLPRMHDFTVQNPDIDLEVNASIALVDFRYDAMDVAIRYGNAGWPGVVADHLFDDEFFPVCSPRLAGGLPRRPQDLARRVLLRSDDEYWQPWFAAAGLDWPEPARGPLFNDSAHMLQAAAQGQGIALGRRSIAGEDIRRGTLVRLFDIAVPSPRRYYLVYPSRLADSPKLAAFRSWIRREAAADASTALRRRGRGAGGGKASRRN